MTACWQTDKKQGSTNRHPIFVAFPSCNARARQLGGRILRDVGGLLGVFLKSRWLRYGFSALRAPDPGFDAALVAHGSALPFCVPDEPPRRAPHRIVGRLPERLRLAQVRAAAQLPSPAWRSLIFFCKMALFGATMRPTSPPHVHRTHGQPRSQ